MRSQEGVTQVFFQKCRVHKKMFTATEDHERRSRLIKKLCCLEYEAVMVSKRGLESVVS
jgi:hypothetical protein